MNCVKSLVNYYNSADFKEQYYFILAEYFSSNKSEIVPKILYLFNVSNYETCNFFGKEFTLTTDQAQSVYDFILVNLDDFICDYISNFVGYTSLQSVSFGEQEVQLQKDDDLGDMEKNGFYVSGEYAYYDLSSSGVYIDLLCKEHKDAILKIITKQIV